MKAFLYAKPVRLARRSPRRRANTSRRSLRSPGLRRAAFGVGLFVVALALSVSIGKAAVVFSTIHSFRVFANGESPYGSLVEGNDGNFYGVTDAGGADGEGTVFRLSSSGVLTTLYSFTGGNDGNEANGLVTGSDGFLYGTAYSGGSNGFGTVFRISTGGVLTTLYSFTGGNDGGEPGSEMVQGKDGSFYGTASIGGTNDLGTVFKITAGGVLTNLHSFGGGNDGSNPGANLIQGIDGLLYGITYSGGSNGYGTVFKISTNGALTTLYVFTGGLDGGNIYAGLVQGVDGYFYGTTGGGGTHSHGSVFRIDASGVLTNLYSFTDGDDGGVPLAGLVQGSDGDFYGTTYTGSTNGFGSMFRISTNGTLTTLWAFTGGDDGLQPDANLVQGSDDQLYGTTPNGGADGGGNVFKASTNGLVTDLYSFTGNVGEGDFPETPLVQGHDGFFYGTTSAGGTSNPYGNGTVFKIGSEGALTTLYVFTGSGDGGVPYAALVQGNDDYFYGTTSSGGTNGRGTVFKISTNGDLTTLYSFTGGSDGGNPEAALVLNSDGYFYGTTFGSGTDYGTVFRMSPGGALTTLYAFTGGNDGSGPACPLVPDTVGNFYGTTSAGGGSNQGTVFRISKNGALTPLYSFTGNNDGAGPFPGLVWGNDGSLYGTTYFGGASNLGTVYRIGTGGGLTTLYSFTGGSDAEGPNGLVRGSDGNFYGTTYGEGRYSPYYGTVFRVSPSGELTTLYTFNTLQNGLAPSAGLVEASDGSFYGTALAGGAGGSGTIFRLALAPVFLSITQTNNSLALTWSTDAGWNYQLQFCSDLTATNWTNLGPLVNATGNTLSNVDSNASGPRRFYRVMLSP